MKRVLDLGPNARFALFDLFGDPPRRGVGQDLALAGAQGDMPAKGFTQVLFAFLNPLAARITEGVAFIAVQERVRLGDVMDVGRGSPACAPAPRRHPPRCAL